MTKYRWATDDFSRTGKAHYYHIVGKVAWSLCGHKHAMTADLQLDPKDHLSQCALCVRSTGTLTK